MAAHFIEIIDECCARAAIGGQNAGGPAAGAGA
jgi:hypothetical protein